MAGEFVDPGYPAAVVLAFDLNLERDRAGHASGSRVYDADVSGLSRLSESAERWR